MKKASIIFLSVICLFSIFAQDKLFIHKTDKSVLEVLVSAIDSINFGANQTELNIHKNDGSLLNYMVSSIDSMNFGSSSDTVKITYSGTTAVVENPLQNRGVNVT